MVALYSIAIRAYYLGIRLASVFSPKARKWIDGRKGLFDSLEARLDKSPEWIWIHAASLGEFEQGRPLIEKLKESHADHKILLTFFSPSGYEVRKDYTAADIVMYMPLDTRANARKFISAIQPKLAVFIKYELWYHHLRELQTQKVPTLLISAQFRPEQFYFKQTGRFFRPVLRGLQHIFVVDKASKELLIKHGVKEVTVSGDTRMDRVLRISREHKDFSFLKNHLNGKRVLVAGSTWPDDEEVIFPAINEGKISAVVAPHEIHPDRLRNLESRVEVAVIRLSQLKPESKVDVIVVDTMGDLSHIYHVADITYVGGGFGAGIHNTLEAAVFGCPVIFGPNYKAFREAHDLISMRCGFEVGQAIEFYELLRLLEDPKRLVSISGQLEKYFQQHAGATDSIYRYISREMLL